MLTKKTRIILISFALSLLTGNAVAAQAWVIENVEVEDVVFLEQNGKNIVQARIIATTDPISTGCAPTDGGIISAWGTTGFNGHRQGIFSALLAAQAQGLRLTSMPLHQPRAIPTMIMAMAA